jgi:acetoin utilization deacetylase AcuC-like enzyme
MGSSDDRRASTRRRAAGRSGCGAVRARLPVVYHEAYSARLAREHRFPMGKFRRLKEHLLASGLVTPQQIHTPEPAPRGLLAGAHDPGYVDAVLEQRLEPQAARRIGLPITPSVVARSRAAVAGTLLTARLALAHGVACNTAGGSHHAFFGHGAGYCVFNDVAVAARGLLVEGAVSRVLVVDLDVHQGDGTAAMCAGDSRIYTFSMHCEANFPACKERGGRDITLPVGLPTQRIASGASP